MWKYLEQKSNAFLIAEVTTVVFIIDEIKKVKYKAKTYIFSVLFV